MSWDTATLKINSLLVNFRPLTPSLTTKTLRPKNLQKWYLLWIIQWTVLKCMFVLHSMGTMLLGPMYFASAAPPVATGEKWRTAILPAWHPILTTHLCIKNQQHLFALRALDESRAWAADESDSVRARAAGGRRKDESRQRQVTLQAISRRWLCRLGDIKVALNASNCRHYTQQIESGPRVGGSAALIVVLWRPRMATVFMRTYVAHEFIGQQTRRIPSAPF